METQPKIGKITIAPEVLETTARLTALAVPGVVRLVSPPGMPRLLRHGEAKIEVIGNSVRVTLYVVTEPDVNMLSVGRQIQAEVTRAIQDMIGMTVQSVDIYIEDIAPGSGPEKEAQAPRQRR
ncbi:MAG TPA: Asp23/Gls24 family envelope stress response protein [Chloroflexi bacterium]|nr:Asp23/Gls24 family envelope stress response protein [Chloroflexota bacterium]